MLGLLIDCMGKSWGGGCGENNFVTIFLRRKTVLAVYIKGETMKNHYSFSKGVRGKFHNPDAVIKLPVYLDESVQTCLTAKADAKGIDLSDLVNDLLKCEIGIIDAVR